MLWSKGLVVGTVDVSNRVFGLRSNLGMAGRGSLLLLRTWNPGRLFFWCVHQLGLMHNASGPFVQKTSLAWDFVRLLLGQQDASESSADAA